MEKPILNYQLSDFDFLKSKNISATLPSIQRNVTFIDFRTGGQQYRRREFLQELLDE
jgi:hypothetical protein